MQLNRYPLIKFLITMVFVITSCGQGTPTSVPTSEIQVSTPGPAPTPMPKNTLSILADHQVWPAFGQSGILEECTRQNSLTVSIEYTSSTDLRNKNAAKDSAYQVFWATSPNFLPNAPTSPKWTAKAYVVPASTVGDDLGWDESLKLMDILSGIPTGEVRLASNNMAIADPALSFLMSSLAAINESTMLTQAQVDALDTDELKKYFGVKRSTDSWESLSTELLDDIKTGSNKYNTVIALDANITQLNPKIIELGGEPFKVYYPQDATSLVTLPMVNVAGPEYQNALNTLVECFHSDENKAKLNSLGYRTDELGMTMDPSTVDTSVFNPDWGINITTEFPYVESPLPSVTSSAVLKFQTVLKPTTYNWICYDGSGSTYGNGAHEQLFGRPLSPEGYVDNGAFDYLYDPDMAVTIGATPGQNDVTGVTIFDDQLHQRGLAYGNDPESSRALLKRLKENEDDYGGGTAIHNCAKFAVSALTHVDPAVDELLNSQGIVFPPFDPNIRYGVYIMSDGQNTDGLGFDWPIVTDDFVGFYDSLPSEKKIPIYTVGFGSGALVGEGSDLWNLATHTNGTVIDASGDMLEGLKKLFANY